METAVWDAHKITNRDADMVTYADLLQEVKSLAGSATNSEGLMQGIAARVHAAKLRYNAVSFRLVDEADREMLILGPHSGGFIPQSRVPFRQGLCGAAASEGRTIVVNNIADDARYLEGSSMVKSEIVVPIFAHGKLVAELDVQSYFTDTFKDPREREFVEACAGVITKYLEEHRG
jgi:L-methionine (R)-S-oxide reductase